jgi:ABC-type uncharacterized transport system substrate-binding protein
MKKLFVYMLLIILIIAGCSANEPDSNKDSIGFDPAIPNSELNSEIPDRTFKILHVMSYHTPWEWTETQFQGFQDALEELNIEYKVFEMDTKNFSTDEEKSQKGEEARQLIESWKPDLLYTTDDDAQEYVGQYYVNTSLPIVFATLSKDPSVYGYDTANNVTGVLEHEHFTENINLLKEISPEVEKIAVIFDEDPMWGPIEKRMREQIPNLEGVTFVSWDYINSFEVYKQRMTELQHEADAIALLGIFTFKDETGQNVHYRDVLKWTAENSRLPDFSFWKDRVTYGTLSTVSVSGYEQGHDAGLLAWEILVGGKTPGDLPIRPSMKGEVLISKARADDLGITLKSQILLSSEVVTEYGWVTDHE